MVIVEGTHGRFDAGFITDIGIMLVEFEDQIGFAVFVHDSFKIFQSEGIGTAFEGSDIHRIKTGCAGDIERGL